MSNAFTKVHHQSIRLSVSLLKRTAKPSLYLLSEAINWKYFEDEVSGLYSKEGRSAHPIWVMVSLLILKSLYNLSDEQLVEQQWEMNPYFQCFGGLEMMQWGQPCAA